MQPHCPNGWVVEEPPATVAAVMTPATMIRRSEYDLAGVVAQMLDHRIRSVPPLTTGSWSASSVAGTCCAAWLAAS